MQCVERGLFTLDEPVETVLPEVKEMKVLAGFDEGGLPKYAAKDKNITLR